MMSDDNLIIWMGEWFQSKCNGDWEHSEGIKIETLDNPGWHVQIDLDGTGLEQFDYSSGLIGKEENDWYVVVIKDGKFEADGDPRKLYFLLEQFRKLVTQRHVP